MKSRPRYYALVAVLCVVPCPGLAAELPKQIQSQACQTAPAIDGVIGDDEWQAAPPIEFEMQMVQLGSPAANTRVCQLRVMNSANGLYLALCVPDPTVNTSLSPVNMDVAMLAFCRGAELRRGDDRKTMMPGLYVDKHFLEQGKDADDSQQDGRGVMTHDQGTCSTLLTSLARTAGARLRFIESTLVSGTPQPVAKVLVEYTYLDTLGEEQVGKAKLYLPANVQDGTAQFPLFCAAGYELDDHSSLRHVQRGFVVVSPRDLQDNPLVRTINPDAALLHIARSLPWVDDARVVIGGGSAGGYMTLMLAAETFPLAGAAADVPPVNWGYNAAYFLQRKNWSDDADPATKAPELPVYAAVASIADQATKVYGDDTDDPIWFRHSPLSQLDTLTCPVLVCWTTADMLVPIDQVGRDWVRPFDPAAFPPGFTMDPDRLCATPAGRLRALDVLPAETYELFTLSEEQIRRLVPPPANDKSAARSEGQAQQATPAEDSSPALPELPFSSSRRWSIVIMDEGAPEPQVGHMKHAVPWTRNAFIDQMAGRDISATQLTRVKLERLMDRYAGKEWLPTRLKHLDFPDSERADVLRGLRLYVAAGADHAATFVDLYQQLPADRQVLAADVYDSIINSAR